MIFSAKVTYDNKAAVCLVGAADKKSAMGKVIHLYSYAEITSIELLEIPKDFIESKLENYYTGGMVLATFEDYGD